MLISQYFLVLNVLNKWFFSASDFLESSRKPSRGNQRAFGTLDRAEFSLVIDSATVVLPALALLFLPPSRWPGTALVSAARRQGRGKLFQKNE